jgi:hypothetical protein
MSLDGVTLYYNTPFSTDLQPVLHVVVTSLHTVGSAVYYDATEYGTPFTGNTISTSALYAYSGTVTTNKSFSATGYSNFSAYAVIDWNNPGGTTTFNARVQRLKVNYTLP